MEKIVIIGAGNFGAATALSLGQKGDAEIKLVDPADFPNPRAASHDINKIVRDDYPDELYMELLIPAMSRWRTHDLYKNYYHQVGMLRADPSDFGEQSIQVYRKLGIANRSEFLPVDEVRTRWNGAFATATFGDLSKVLYNPDVGFAEADKALGAVVKAAVDLPNVAHVKDEMQSLTFGPSGQCTGVLLKSGETLQADKVLIAAGARTAPLLAQSDPQNKDLHAGDRVMATGAVSFYAKLHGEQKDKFAPIPVLKNCLPEVKGEGMSILKDGTIKFNCDMCFTNFVDFPATGERMSCPPDENGLNTWTGPLFLRYFQDRARRTIEGLYGAEVEGIEIEGYRMCWDASTPTHDFLITPHPNCEGLYVATGGSFHGWKFLPVIGDCIADMMEGNLNAELAERWAWDKKNHTGRSANPTYQIKGDLQSWM